MRWLAYASGGLALGAVAVFPIIEGGDPWPFLLGTGVAVGALEAVLLRRRAALKRPSPLRQALNVSLAFALATGGALVTVVLFFLTHLAG